MVSFKFLSLGMAVAKSLRFCDVAMEFEPLTSGCRLTLIYSIVQSQKECFPSVSLTQRNDFPEALRLWKILNDSKGPEIPGILAWILEDEVKNKSFSLSALNSRDSQLASMLSDICSKRGVYLYLANVTRTITGTCGPFDDDDWPEEYLPDIVDIDERTNVTICLDEVVHLNGK